MSQLEFERMAGLMPIWYVVSRREMSYPFNQYGVCHVIACVPCDFKDMEAMYKRYVAPISNSAQGWYPEVHIYSRSPAEFGRMTDEAMRRDEDELRAIMNRAHDLDVKRRAEKENE